MPAPSDDTAHPYHRGCEMARKNRINGGYVIVPKNTLKCKQWQELTAGARVVYLTILTEFIRDKKLNPENTVKITHRQIEERSGLGHATVVRSMKALKEAKFISVEQQGGLERNYSIYKLNGRFLY